MEKSPQPEERIPLRDRTIPEIASELQAVLGQRIPAYAISERNPRKIGAFARGEEKPGEEAEASLRDMAEVTERLIAQASPDAIRTWLVGNNGNLDGRAPLEVFHEGDHSAALAAATNIWDSDLPRFEIAS